MPVYHVNEHRSPWRSEETPESLELEVEMVESHCISAGNPT